MTVKSVKLGDFHELQITDSGWARVCEPVSTFAEYAKNSDPGATLCIELGPDTVRALHAALREHFEAKVPA